MTSPQPPAAERQDTVIIGLGNALRRDDGVGPLVLDAFRYESVPNCDLVEIDGASTGQITDAWRSRKLAIVVDAMCIGHPAGTLHDFQVVDLANVTVASMVMNSEFVTVAEALARGRKLGHLPKALRLVGIEPGDLKRGFGLSPPVAASMDDLVALVRMASARAADPGPSNP